MSVKGRARFQWIEGVGEGNWWNETFAYVLDFDDEAKVTDYQVWADSGAAYLAWTGKLNALREVTRRRCCSALSLTGRCRSTKNKRKHNFHDTQPGHVCNHSCINHSKSHNKQTNSIIEA